jgi:hypothetical protein
MITFGHWPAAIDWIWMSCLLNDDPLELPGGAHSVLYYNSQLITDLDPAFRDIYLSAASLLSVIHRDGAGARELMLKAETFLEQGLPLLPKTIQERYWKQPWAVEVVLAYVYLFDLNDMPHAAQVFRKASRFSDAPAYVHSLARKLFEKEGQYVVGLNLLSFMIAGATDDKLRSELEKKQSNLRFNHLLFQINAAFVEYLQKRKKQIKTEAWDIFQRDRKGVIPAFLRGTLFLDKEGKVATSIPHLQVFGLN